MTAPIYPTRRRLVEKSVGLGAVREMLPPTDHIGLQFAPFLEVETDDVHFDYLKGGFSEGLAPARAEDAESELAQVDEGSFVQGRASTIDWTLKDSYSPSDVTKYTDALIIAESLQGRTDLTLPGGGFVGSTVTDFRTRVAKHDRLRRRKLDNRIEHLIMSGLEFARNTYNDGKIFYDVPYGRPADQQDQAPASGNLWGTVDSDPIGDLIAINDLMWQRYKITLNRAIISRKVARSMWKSKKFLAAVIGVQATNTNPIDLNYLSTSWGPEAALKAVSDATGIAFTIYDSVYRTRPFGGDSTTWVNNRFTSDNKVILLPDESMLEQIDDTQLGFAKTLTSPHPEGNWTAGFYEWEQDRIDPWSHDRGTGIKAFPIFPFMEYSYVATVMA